MPKRGYKQTTEHIEKCRINKIGKKFTNEHRIKLSLSKKGKDNPSWLGGVSDVNKRIRNSVEYKLWRESVFIRDDYTCQKTKKRGERLHPHHILNFSEHPELRFAIDNGITLSEKSHKEFHKIYGERNNTKEQLKEFYNTYKKYYE